MSPLSAAAYVILIGSFLKDVCAQFPIRRYALVAEIGTAILNVIDIAITTIHD
jgi:hypothetical protein